MLMQIIKMIKELFVSAEQREEQRKAEALAELHGLVNSIAYMLKPKDLADIRADLGKLPHHPLEAVLSYKDNVRALRLRLIRQYHRTY